MTKKISFIILIVTLIATFTVGCGSKSTSGDAQGEYKLEEVKDLDKVPQEFKDQFQALSKHRGYAIEEAGENQYWLFIALGEKRTGGYDILAKGVTVEDDKIVVTFEEVEPDGMVIQAITYPYKVFRLEGKIEDLTKLVVKNQAGEELEVIDPKAVNENEDDNLVKGEYVGQIDTHSVEIIVNGEAMAFEIAEVESKLEELELSEGDEILISYDKNDNGQLVLKSVRNAELSREHDELPILSEGTFMGREDTHSITVSVNKTIQSYQTWDVEDNLTNLNLQEGDMIKFSYLEENNNLVIKTIEVLERAKKQ